MVFLSPADIQYQLAHIHDDRSFDIVISHAICLPLAAIAVVLRLISRRLSKAPIQADDWLIILALLFLTGEITAGFLDVRFGGGKHAILLKDPIKFAKMVLVTELFYPCAIAAVKLSVLLLYRRLFPNRRFRIVIWCVGGFISCSTIILTLVQLFQCRPIKAGWEPFMKGSCMHVSIEIMFMACLNVLTDFITLMLPIPLLWRLQMPRKQKLQLIGIFLTSGIVCIISIYRVPRQKGLSLEDAPWSDVDACVWSVAEVSVGIVSACLPTLRPLFTRRPKPHSSRPRHHGRLTKTEESWPTKLKHVHTTITAVPPSRPRSRDGGGFVRLNTTIDTRYSEA